MPTGTLTSKVVPELVTAHRDRPVVSFYDRLHDREAQTCPLCLSVRDKRFENSWQDVRRDPAAGVGDLETDHVAFALHAESERTAAGLFIASRSCATGS